MIGLLHGTVHGGRGGKIVVLTEGVGYLVAVRSPFDFTPGSTVTLHTHLAVRENALDLYGFQNEEELRMFEELITLPKIGPKTAMQILMQADVAILKKAILSQDPVYLTKMSGIGKKTAEKVVTELRERFGADAVSEYTGGPDADVIDALMALGYTQKDARDALVKIPTDVTDTKKRITEALRIVSR